MIRGIAGKAIFVLENYGIPVSLLTTLEGIEFNSVLPFSSVSLQCILLGGMKTIFGMN